MVDTGYGVGPLKNSRLPRLRRSHRAPRRERHPRALRQPLRHVRAHHRREPLQGADAHLPGHPLHDGRAVGRLQPHDHRARALRHRRGQLRRPGRQPPRRLGAHAGPGRRLLRAALHDRRLPLGPARPAGRCRPTTRSSRRPRPPLTADIDRWLSVGGTKSVDHYHRELGKIMWDYCGMARDRAGLEKALAEIPALRARVREERAGARLGRDRQPVAREGAAGRRLLRAGRADVPRRPACARRAAAATSGSSTRPPRARPSATTSNFAFVGAWEWQGKATPRSSTRSRSSSSTSTSPRGATSSDGPPPEDLAAERPDRRRPLRGLRGRRHQRRHVVPRDARRHQRGPHRRRAASPSCSTATAARASAARAA